MGYKESSESRRYLQRLKRLGKENGLVSSRILILHPRAGYGYFFYCLDYCCNCFRDLFSKLALLYFINSCFISGFFPLESFLYRTTELLSEYMGHWAESGICSRILFVISTFSILTNQIQTEGQYLG